MADKTREQRSAIALRNEAAKRLAHLEKLSLLQPITPKSLL